MAERIRILSEETVNRVAAGEVVERPAAALKELLENSLDAGATRVAVELVRAGKGLIRVADDGCGMSHDDALLALERHATSKIADVGDLASVATLGFRGEALPSIAAVSRLRLSTRARGEPQGTRIEVDGGRILRVSPCGCPEGTEIEVRDLFCTVPARLKFLRSDETELGHCLHVAARLALAVPRFALSLSHGGRALLVLPHAADPAARLRGYLDRDFVAGLVPVRGAAGDVAVDGFVARPGAGRPGADYQQFFVNARPVRDSLLLQGVKEACRDFFLQEAAGVSFFLWITLPPALVDVNVHPTKREVRFRDLGAVRRVVGDAVRAALREDRSALFSGPALTSAARGPRAAGHGTGLAAAGSSFVAGAAEARAAAYTAASASPSLLPESPADAPPSFETAGAPAQLFDTYLVCRRPEGLVLVDQHAAHERVVYERVLARTPDAASQRLLAPLHFEVAPGEAEALDGLRPALEAVGVSAEPFGPRSWRISALPPELPGESAVAFVRELLALEREGAAAPRVEDFRRRAAAVLACHGAVRAGQRLGPPQIAALLADLARTENPSVCPHGRPTAITIDRDEIERRFKRT